MIQTRKVLVVAMATALVGCTQLGGYGASPAYGGALQDAGRAPRAAGNDDRVNGRPYGRTRARLQFIREEIEFDELDLDYDNAPDADIFDAERDRYGFRGEFGSRGVGGFFQIFGEEFRSPFLIGEEMDTFGVGAGVAGMPTVGRSGRLEFIVPFRFGFNVAGGSESVGGFDSDLLYAEAEYECGFGVRAFGAQASTGLIANSFGGLFESDDPARLSNDDPTVITGTNVGAYFEMLYKHDRVPLMAKARAIVGDITGVMFSFGFAF